MKTVTMELPETAIRHADHIQHRLSLSNNAQSTVEAMSVLYQIVESLKEGGKVLVENPGEESRIIIKCPEVKNTL